MVYRTESSWHTREKVRQINGVSTITYSKIRRDDMKERKRRKIPSNGTIRVKDEENRGTAMAKNVTIGTKCGDADE